MSEGLVRILRLTVFCLPATFAMPIVAVVQPQQPFTLIATTKLPDVDGDFDHFAYDLKRNRLISAAEEHHTLEIFDLKTGKHLRSIDGFKAPHSIAYVPEKDELFVVDGEDASCIILSATDFHRVSRIPLLAGADAALYDAASKRLYVGNGGREEKKNISNIAIISVSEGKKIGEIPIDGDNIEAMAIDHMHNRMFVNIRDKKQIGVINLFSNKTINTWTTPGMNRNTSMRFDNVHQRIFVAGRSPGKFYVFNSVDGTLVSALDCVDMADDMTWDPTSHRIYVTGSEGISVFDQKNKDSYEQLSRAATIGGKTSIYVPELRQFYVAHPKNDTSTASLLVYRVNP